VSGFFVICVVTFDTVSWCALVLVLFVTFATWRFSVCAQEWPEQIVIDLGREPGVRGVTIQTLVAKAGLFVVGVNAFVRVLLGMASDALCRQTSKLGFVFMNVTACTRR